jgi:excisionase family DNA binding protein
MTGLTRKQAAELAGVSEATISYWVKRGLLPAPRPGFAHALNPNAVLAAQQAVHVGDIVPRWRANPTHAGRRLRALREGAGLTQQELSARASLTHEEISRLEHGEQSPQAPTVHKLSQALGVAPERFVDDTSLGLELLSMREAGQRLDVPAGRVRKWMQQGVLPGVKVGVEWRVPAIAVAELDRSGRLRGRSRRLDPRYRG